MSVTGVFNSIAFLKRAITLRKKSSRSLVRGEYVTTDAADEIVQAAIFPATAEDQKIFPPLEEIAWPMAKAWQMIFFYFFINK